MTNPALASWIGVDINKHTLVDETEFLQLGATDEVDYEKLSFIEAQPSALRVWPTEEDPTPFYKLSSFWVEFGRSLTETERQTYSFLEFLGDIGGLFDGFRYIGGPLIAPIATFTLQSTLLFHAFR